METKDKNNAASRKTAHTITRLNLYLKPAFIMLVLVLCGGGRATAQLAIAATSSGSIADGTATTTITVNHNPGSALNKVLVVAVQTVGGVTITEVTYDGDPLEQVGSTVTNGTRSQIAFYYMVDPAEPISPATTLPIVATFGSTNGGVVMGVITFSGALISNPFRTFSSGIGTGATATLTTVETANGDIVIGGASWRDSPALLTFGTDQTARWNIRTGTGNDAVAGGGSTKPITTNITSTNISFGQVDGREYAAAAFSIIPISLADLQITKTVNNSTPYIGQSITFTLTATNLSLLNNAPNVTVDDLLPNGYTYQSHSTATGTYNGGTGVWDIGTLNASATATLTITALVNASGSYTNTATITGDVVDNTTGNNTATATISACQAGGTAPLFNN